MNPTREEALFELALEKPAEKRAAFLDAMCEDRFDAGRSEVQQHVALRWHLDIECE
jgi:hypothetical protein